MAPSASLYYGMPQDLREAGAGSLSELVEAARQAASQGMGDAGRAAAEEEDCVPKTGD